MIPRDDGFDEGDDDYPEHLKTEESEDEDLSTFILITGPTSISHLQPDDYFTTEMPADRPIPSGGPPFGGPPGPRPTGPPQSTLQTLTTSSINSALPENGGSSTGPTAISTSDVPAPSVTGDGFHGGGGGGGKPTTAKGPERNHGAMYAAAGVVPVVVLAIIAAVVFFCLRKRKRRNNQLPTGTVAKVHGQEMKSTNQASIQPYMAPPPAQSHYTAPPSHPPPPTQPHYTAPPSHPPPPAIPASPPPVILGPIGSGNNGAYFTGIDTSDVVSMNERPTDRTGLGDPFADGNSLHEEPPPPYRPRSLAPLSRDTSLRAPETSSRTNLVGGQAQPVRSPFDDPSDDDDISEVSAPALRGNDDGMSAVSDLSYQADPVVTRPSV